MAGSIGCDSVCILIAEMLIFQAKLGGNLPIYADGGKAGISMAEFTHELGLFVRTGQ